jgi:hypothetical protein
MRKAPRMAPTAMKTVPSGALECCMKGAFLVGGTVGGGYVGTFPPGFVSVGRPVGPESLPPLDEEELCLLLLLLFWARTGEARTATARVDKKLEARMFTEA